jgi:hypothetical protein
MVARWASRPAAPGAEGLEWEELTPQGNPPGADDAGRIAWSVPAGRALAVEVSGTWVRTDRKRHEIAALAADERRTDVVAVATEDDLHFFGQVFDAATQAPVADVEIQLERRPAIEPIAVSDEHGLFELRTNSWESRKARAGKRGFAPVAFEVDEQHESDSHAQRLELTHAATIQGYYHDCDDKPVAEGSLRFWTSSGFAAHVYPREDGWFEADSLPTGEAVKVDLELEHRPIAREVASIVLEPGESRRVDWKLPQRYALHGIVLDERGEPVQAGELALYFGTAADPHCLGVNSPLDERDDCTSDAQGRFTFTKAGAGSWVIALVHTGGSSAFLRSPYNWHIALAAENITVPGAEQEEIVLHCWRYLTLEGRILDPEDHPIPRAEVDAKLVGCDANVQRATSAEGLFSVPLPVPGSYELSVKSSRSFLGSEKIAVRAGEHDIVVKLRRAPALRVRVVDEPSGKPLRASIFAVGTNGTRISIWEWERGQDSIELSAPCPADTYRIFAHSFDGRCGTLEGAIVDPESPSREWTIPLAPGKRARIRSSNAGGEFEVEFTWNGIPIDRAELRPRQVYTVDVLPGTLSARYRLTSPTGEWFTLETPIDDASPVDIDLRFP